MSNQPDNKYNWEWDLTSGTVAATCQNCNARLSFVCTHNLKEQTAQLADFLEFVIDLHELNCWGEIICLWTGLEVNRCDATR